MPAAYTGEQIRAAEAPLLATTAPDALMRTAARGLATAVTELLTRVYGVQVLLVVGAGNNGGDALYAGADLARRGAQVEAVLLAGDRTHPTARAAFNRAGGRIVTSPRTSQAYDVAVDGIVGIGGSGPLRSDAATVVAAAGSVPWVAVDVPSGVDADTGRIEGAHIRAVLTVTFGALKPAHLVDPGALACGVVEVVELGLDLPRARFGALSAAQVVALLPTPEPTAHKYSRGVVGVRSGSQQYPGAALLSVAGAASGLAGMVRYVPPSQASDPGRSVPVTSADTGAAGHDPSHRSGPGLAAGEGGPGRGPSGGSEGGVSAEGGSVVGGAGGGDAGRSSADPGHGPTLAAADGRGPDRAADPVAALVQGAHPEVVMGAGRVQAWVVGSGGGAGVRAHVLAAWADEVPVVIDADALGALSALGESPGGEHLALTLGGARRGQAILTPHAGELARLLGIERTAVEADQLSCARQAAEKFESVVVAKNRHTLIVDPDGSVRVTTVGPAWLATAGAGDVLAGLIGALAATGLSTFDAASVGCWVHGAAAQVASQGGPLTAGRVAAAIAPTCALLLGRGDQPADRGSETLER